MYKTLTAALVSGAIALGGSAAPARADRGETLRTILGVAALAVIANELARDRKRVETHRPAPPPAQPPYWDHHPSRGDKWLPAACAFEIRDRDGDRRTVLGKSCLEDRAGDVRLPRDCAFKVRVWGERKTVYGQRCLERRGWTIGSRY